MKLYYKALGSDGKNSFGIVDAKDASEAARYLRSHNIYPIKITEQTEKKLSFTFNSSVKSSDLLFFTRQLSSLLLSGLNLMQSLKIIANQIESKAMSTVLLRIIADIEGGFSLSVALQKHPQIFSPIYISLIKAAESSGILDKVLLRLADNLEKDQKLKAQLRSALMYPAIVITLMFVVVGVMMVFVIPQLRGLYDSLNVSLPWSTQLLILASDFTVNFWYIILIIIAAILFLFRRWYKTIAGRIILDTIFLHTPIFGKLIHNSMLTEFTRTFGLMIESGSLIVNSLQQTSKIVGNVLFEKAIFRVADKVSKGVSIGDAMGSSVLFPPVLVELIKIGEQTGKLDESLQKSSEYFERETESTLKKLMTVLEPLIILVLGIGVAFLLFSVITPIYEITNSF